MAIEKVVLAIEVRDEDVEEAEVRQSVLQSCALYKRDSCLVEQYRGLFEFREKQYNLRK